MDLPSNLEVTVVFKGVDSAPSIKEHAAKKVAKLSKHLHGMINCHFTFLHERNESVAELHIVAGDYEAKAEARGANLFAAIDEVVEKVLHQSRKHKEKVTDHKKNEGHRNQTDE